MADVNEIYEAVLEQCIKQIDEIKHEYGNQLVEIIADQISMKYEERIMKLESDNRKLNEEISALKARVGSTGTNSSASSQKASNNSTIKSNRININEINRYSCFEFSGWLFYANDKMGNFLYKVKTDGTENQQLTDYSVCTMSSAKVKDGKLYFMDKDYRERTINL